MRTRHFGSSKMQYPVVNTFIHYPLARQTRRCRSSPPEVQVHLAISQAIAVANSRTPRRRRRRRALARGDDQTLSEFRHLTICENWRHLAQMMKTQYRREVWEETRTWIIAFKAAQRLPQKVDAVPHQLFKQIANCLDLWHGEFILLLGAGTLRMRDKEMEIWAPDTQRTKRQEDLVAYAKLFKGFVERREFVLRIPMDRGVACTPMRLRADMLVKDLKDIAAVCCGVLAEKLRMTHLGVELKHGTLLEHGVRPGSCIIVLEVFDI